MNDNMRIYEQVRAVPPEALKQIQGGRLKGMSDINPMWRLKKLTEMFGICGIGWKIDITDKRLEKGSGNEVVCFVDINLYVKVDGEWSAAIPGMGGSSFIAQEKNGPFTSDECFKMAYTDAISVACKSLGFAADVYFEKDRTKYDDAGERQQNAPRGQQTGANTNRSSNPSETFNRNSEPPGGEGEGASHEPAMISEPQVRLLGKLRTELNVSDDVFRKTLKELFHVESTKELTKHQASGLISSLQKKVKAKSGAA